MKDYVKKVVSFSIGPIVSAIIGFITIPVTSNLIAADQFGMASMYTLLNNILTVVVLIGIDQAFMREFNEEEDKQKLLVNAVFIPLTLTIIVATVLIMFKSFFANLVYDDSTQTFSIISLALCMPLFIIEKFILLTLRMQEKGVRYSFWLIASKTLNLILVIVLLIYYKRNFESIIYANLFSQLLVSVLILVVERKNSKISFSKIDKNLLIKLLKFGLPLIPATIISWALNSMDMIFLRALSDFTEVGYYSVALKMVSVVAIIQTSFTTLWAPMAFKWKKEKAENKKYEVVSDIISFVMVSVFILIMMFKQIIPYILSNEYRNTIYILPFLLFYPIYYTISETTTLGISFSRKTYYNIIVSALALIVNLFLNWIFIPVFGGIGAAFATGICYMVFFWCRTIISRNLWYKFNIAKYVYISIATLIIATVNSFVKDSLILLLINVIGLTLTVVVYRDLINKGISMLKKNSKLKITLVCYQTQAGQLKDLLCTNKTYCNVVILENEGKLKRVFKLLKGLMVSDLFYFGHGWARNSLYIKCSKIFNKKVIMHWIGSDVLTAKDNLIETNKVQRCVNLNLGCSTLIVKELSDIGIQAKEIPILPNTINSDISAVPKEHSVIAYIPKGKETFYGLPYIKAAAEKYKDIVFNIVGNDDDTLNLKNVKFLGKLSLNEMDRLYNNCSILIRMPKHDGLSLMLLEALLKGKDVIYCYDFPYCRKANTAEELLEVLDPILAAKPKMNENGRQYILNNYNIDNVKIKLQNILINCVEENNGKS